ncbi:Nn.00g010020.m01.CDS01 [Neocucurbitaria sp. VM-36]
MQSTTLYKEPVATESVARSQRVAIDNNRDTEWLRTLGSLRPARPPLSTVDIEPMVFSTTSQNQGNTIVTEPNSMQHPVNEYRTLDALEDKFDNDLDTDLAKAAMDTGTIAFEAQQWIEATSLFREALQVLQQLSAQQREFCDIFILHYKLAVCAYYTQDPIDAEEALLSLVRQPVSSDEHRRCIYEATHLLSQLYVRLGQIDHARSECEKALQARRRLLGKQNNASLESTALMAHIYVLLNNRARAKSCMAMIPEARREEITMIVEKSLGATLEHLEFSSLLSRPIMEGSEPFTTRTQNRLSSSTLGQPAENGVYCLEPTRISSSSASSLSPHQVVRPDTKHLDNKRCLTERSHSPTKGVCSWELDGANGRYSTVLTALDTVALDQDENSTAKASFLSRKVILDNMGCHPRDRIEDAICEGDHSALTSLLNKRKDSWRLKLRKRVRSERVTALHFAALFGEVDMARHLLGSNFNINEVPYGYSTSLTPLKFAIGARRVDMVEFLIANGARPVEPDSWSTLAGQLMSRSWLTKTMSEAERESIPSRIIAVFGILLRHGWDLSVPFETSGRTVLHQAVTFWTGSYTWDLNLRTEITLFLCNRGANPFQRDIEGKTPYDMASTSGHQDLLLILDRHAKCEELDDSFAGRAELSAQSHEVEKYYLFFGPTKQKQSWCSCYIDGRFSCGNIYFANTTFFHIRPQAKENTESRPFFTR